MLKDKQDRLDSVCAIVAGDDAWSDFWDDYGRLILFELKKHEIYQEAVRNDIFQELVLQLLKHDKRALRRYISNPNSHGFACYLRVILRSVIINFYRKHNRHDNIEHHADAELLANSSSSEWAKDPLTTNTQHAHKERVFLSVCGNNRDSEIFRILCLRFIEQESVNHIAKRLSLKPNTVSQRIRYYLKQIEKQFGEDLIKVLNE